jgi:tripartite-type tricarboxylate transporter receptor subunit TctC
LKLHTLVLAGLIICAPALSQEFPSKPIRIISPFAPGGATDTLGRSLSTPMTKALGQNVIVENRAGGSTVIGTELLVRAPADGHTMLVISPSFTVNPYVRKLSYDPLKDFTHLTRLASTAMIIASHPSVPAKNIKELVALARSRPGMLTYGTASVIGSQRIAGELFKSVAGVDITHVPYNGGAPATLATVGGHTTLLVTNIIEVAPNVRAGKLRALGVTTINRSEVLPEVPTIAESGYPGFDTGNWFGISLRNGTPKAVVDRLHTEIVRALDLPEVREPLARSGLTAAPLTPDQFTAFLRGEMERNGKIVKALNLKIE